jgi:pyruvate dehydrogenase E2 component (dihydrolipoamide acetyltransferase)
MHGLLWFLALASTCAAPHPTWRRVFERSVSMGDIVLDPELQEAVEAGDTALLECWLASEGDRVHAGETIAQVRAAHALIDIAAPHDGVLEQILVPAGERFTPGHVLARVVDF